MQRTTLAAVIAGLFTLPVQAAEIPSLDEIIVTATRIPTPDLLAPYASEVHTRRAIERSGAATLYDYLAQHSSVQVLPGYGNKFAPKLDMRGYGIGDGYQNIVLTVDGRRLNNIDGAPQLLGTIPLADIERIEITKGSGSVMFGDGATAGSIQIITRAHQGISVQASAGNHGASSGTFTAGLRKERVSLRASADYAHLDGYRDADVTGHKDESSNRTWQGGLELRPLDRLILGLDLASTRIDTRYGGVLNQNQFNTDPGQNGGTTYTRQRFESDLWRVHTGLELNRNWSLTASHSNEDKLSKYSTGWKSDYDYLADDLALQYRGGDFDLTTGVQTFDGTRINRNGWADNDFRKKNTGWYAQGQYRLDGTTFSIGGRAERVAYTYALVAGTVLKADHNLKAWDLGMNHRLDEQLSLFANYNRAYQAPDIDRFFDSNGAFTGLLPPSSSQTLNIGLNHVTPANRLKLTLFRANLNNEIYYRSTGPWSGFNTNLDKTHKYGLELQDTWRVSDLFTVSLNYAYTRAIIDRENEGGGTFDGKDLPGVPRHGATLGLAYRLSTASSVNFSHTWRSATWAADDFDNNNAQKQAAYESTDVAWRYRRNHLEWFASVENLFERKNGLWTADNAIYPVNFTRNWRLGMKATF